jgi:sodium/potassium-transporting ATPase subunit alpha
MLIIVYVPIFNSFFQTEPIPVQFFFLPLGFAAIIITMDEIRKLLVRKQLLGFHKFGW